MGTSRLTQRLCRSRPRFVGFEPQFDPAGSARAGARAQRVAALTGLLVLASCASNPPPEASSPGAGESAAAPPAASEPASSSSPNVAASPAAPATASDVLAKDRSRFDACYAHARVADPRLGRTSVEITFAVDPTGAPTTVDLRYRNRFDDAAKDCMRDAALAMRFPASMQGAQSATIAFAPPTP